MMDRIGRRYWSEDFGEKTLKESLHRDDRFKEITAASIAGGSARIVMEDLDDLAVLLLFSVFEANVRDRILEEMDREMAAPPRHPALVKAIADAKYAIEHGSFGGLTEAYKSLNSDVKTQVDQVRHYRNWVAHGRRGSARNNVDPEQALTRLEDFLKLLDSSVVAPAPVGLMEPPLEQPIA